MADMASRFRGDNNTAGGDYEAKRERPPELVRGRAMARPTDLAEDEVMVSPSLVVVEAVLPPFSCSSLLLSVLVYVRV